MKRGDGETRNKREEGVHNKRQRVRREGERERHFVGENGRYWTFVGEEIEMWKRK